MRAGVDAAKDQAQYISLMTPAHRMCRRAHRAPPLKGIVAAALLLLAGCRVDPGQCSLAQDRLCVQVNLAAGLALPDALQITGRTDGGQRVQQQVQDGVAQALSQRARYVFEIDLAPVSGAAQISVDVVAHQASQAYAQGGAAWHKGDPQPLVVTLSPLVSARDMAGGQDAGQDGGPRCDPAQCAGCCQGATCVSPALFPNCGRPGTACATCDGRSDRCDASGLCSCGGFAACDVGQRCQGAVCTCDGKSCPNGCCLNNRCTNPVFPTCGSSGSGGAACATCDKRSDRCYLGDMGLGVCSCGSKGRPCPSPGDSCSFGECV